MAARAARLENQDAIDASIVGMLGDPKEVGSYMIIYITFSCLQNMLFNLIVVVVVLCFY